MKKIVSFVLFITIALSLLPHNMVMAENSFVDVYSYEDLINSEIQYDLNFDGINDSLKTELYANYWAYWSFNINNKKILYNITRHGSYEKVYVTDINTDDKYLDIILINCYKGLSADIFRFDGQSLLKSTEFYTVSDDRAVTADNMDISIVTGNSDITFIFGDESFEYKNVDSFEKINLGDNYKSGFNAYKDILLTTQFSKYTLYDIDRDQMPELILSDDSDGFSECEIYTYGENGITKIAEDTIHYGVYSTGWGGILFETGGTGVVSFTQKNIENGELVESSDTFLSACYTPGYENFVFQGNEVSESEYNAHKPTEDDKLQFVQKNDLQLLKDMLYQNEKEIKVLLNGEEVEFDQPPVMINDRVMVPIRAIFEAMGYSVNWNGDTQTAQAIKSNNNIIVQINNNIIKYTINGVSGAYECDVVPQIISERTLVPVRAIAESAGCDVQWDGDNQTVIITI